MSQSRIVELSHEFTFGASHTLHREIDAEPSRRLHGHTYHVVVTIRGEVDHSSGMLLDAGFFTRLLDEVRGEIHDRVLDDMDDLGPSTMENISIWLWNRLRNTLEDLYEVTVRRDSIGQTCRYRG